MILAYFSPDVVLPVASVFVVRPLARAASLRLQCCGT